MSAINRRQFIAGTTTVAAASTLSACGNPDQQTVVRPEGVPVSPFGAKSTAMEVTEGLDLTGQTAFITGCNSGLGLETMRVLSLRGANIIGAARTIEKAESALNTLDGPGTPVVCELGDLASVAACGETVKQLGIPIDMLILNAGIMALPELEQINGIEKQFFVNHLGHFTLTSHLLKQVEAAPQGRIVVVSSSGHQFAPDDGIDFRSFHGPVFGSYTLSRRTQWTDPTSWRSECRGASGRRCKPYSSVRSWPSSKSERAGSAIPTR